MRAFLTLIFAAAASTAQPAIVGNWLGTLDAGPVQLRLVFHITESVEGLRATFDSLDQGLRGAPVSQVTVSGSTVRLAVASLRASFEGTLSADAARLTGTFTQTAASAVELRKVDRFELMPRPQEPRAPFPYTSSEVNYESRGSRLAGTLTTPSGAGPFPAVLLLSGSGAQDRDGTLAAHKPFLVLADYLTRRGIAVLRVDDRGVGRSSGAAGEQTLLEMAQDALAGVAFLKTQATLDSKRLGLIGHGEGGMVAPLAAVRTPDVKFLVTLAGVGIPGDEMLFAQAEELARAAGVTEDIIAQNRAMQAMVFQMLRDRDPAQGNLTTDLQTIRTSFQAEQQLSTLQRRLVAVNAPAIRSVVLSAPAEVFRQVRVPVLALNGSRDAQVPAAKHLPGMAAALAAGGNSDFTVAVLPGLNHQFQTCNTCQPAEYGELEETFSPVALNLMGDWIVRQVLPR